MNTKRAIGTRSLCILCAFAASLGAREAAAEVTLVNTGTWEAYTDGRIGGFVSYVRGDGYPRIKLDPNTMNPVQNPLGGGISTNDANPIDDPNNPPPQPRLESVRIRSGFVGNILGIGVRTHLASNKLTMYTQLWSDIESESRRKYVPMPVDVRQAYLKVEGSWGGLTVGRQGTLFSRGAAEIDFMYGHGYGVGFPTAVDSSGMAAGHVGTGVLGPGFAAGAVYATPAFVGLQLNVGVFDPVAIVGAWDRTKWPRPEGELTYDVDFGGHAKIHLFVNGGYQAAYRIGERDGIWTSATGVGYGGRFEVGPVHLGLASHYGRGLGLYYALEASDASYDTSPAHRLRNSDGYYAQAQVALSKFDLNAGAGISRIIPLGSETVVLNGMPVAIPADGAADVNGQRRSLIKYQLGLSGAVVYHFSPSLHFDVDYFRAAFKWQLGESQVAHFVNTGLTATW